MTNDEAIYVLKNTAWLGWDKQKEKVTEAVRMAVEALKTQLPKEDTTSDCISRQEAIRIASGYCHPANIAKELAKLPSAQPERKKGKWIPVTRIEEWSKEEGLTGFPPEVAEFPNCTIKYVDATEPDEVDAVKCSECGTVFDFTDARNWCSECGADMRGEQDE